MTAMTPLTPTPSRRGLFFGWLWTNIIAAVIFLFCLAGAGFAAAMGIVYAAMGGNVVAGLVFGLAALALAVAGVAVLGAFQGQALGLSWREGGLLMVLAALAMAAVQFLGVPLLLEVLIPAHRRSLAFSPLEAFVVALAPSLGGLFLGFCQSRLVPWLRPRALTWTLATGLGWGLGAIVLRLSILVRYNSSANVNAIGAYLMTAPALVIMVLVTGLAYAYLRSAAPAQPGPERVVPAPTA
jgi:hypothetical protein